MITFFLNLVQVGNALVKYLGGDPSDLNALQDTVPNLGPGCTEIPEDLDATPFFFAPQKIRGAQISPDGDGAGTR